VEADEFYLGGPKSGKRGPGAEHKCAVTIGVARKNPKLGRLRLQVIEDCSADELVPFVQINVDPGSGITTDGWLGYNPLPAGDYKHQKVFKNKAKGRESVLPGVHLVISLEKRLILGTFQGRFEKKYLQRYLDEYVFRFNRRTTKSVGKRLYRIVQQSMATPVMTRKQVFAGCIAQF